MTRRGRGPTRSPEQQLLDVVTEKELQEQLVHVARLLGWEVFHTFDSRRTEWGEPDLRLLRPPRVMLWELKTERGQLTPAQQRIGEKLLQCPGIEYRVVRPSTVDEALEALR